MNITESAQKKIETLLEAQDNKDILLRVSVIGGGCSGFQYDMGFDTIREDDEQYGQIIVDSMSFQYLQNVTLDFVESLQGSGFTFDNPTKRSCGCGKSFSA